MTGGCPLGLVGGFGSVSRRNSRELFGRTCNPSQRGAEVRQVYKGEQKGGDPKHMQMRKQCDQAQHRNDLELQLLRSVRKAFGQSVKVQENVSDRQDRDEQEYPHRDHENVGLIRRRDEPWQMMGRRRMNGMGHRINSKVPPLLIPDGRRIADFDEFTTYS
jgi:hypothetical protein